MKKNIAPKIENGAAEWISSMFPSLNAGATFMLEAMPDIYRQSLAEMNFDNDELVIIIDVLKDHNKTMCKGSASMAGRYLPLKIKDACRDHDHDDPESFPFRINNLPRFHVVCLEIWAANFWQQKEKTREEWVDTF